MDLGLKGKTALVAAASRGLGKATAMGLAKEGANVVIAARDEGTLRATAEEIRRATGSRVLAVPADLNQVEDIEALVRATESEFGQIDILINNAGGPPSGGFTDVGDEAWLHAVNLNLMSAIRLTRLVLSGMRERGWGRIVNIVSSSVKEPMPTLILSGAVRSSIVSMAKTLSRQVAAEGITVNNVAPGYILTDRVRDLARSRAENEGKNVEEVIEEMTVSTPMARMGQPEELAALITFLASECASYITGTTIQADGGQLHGLL
ncbi:MAG: hypothetical protein A2Y73_03830 [Chloroflexi bacterium RBG_13_56_8]|nr:MAG: hypothetical protein A2Y73_03830 [Chloroflexi bacterium RBG_13_56_8]